MGGLVAVGFSDPVITKDDDSLMAADIDAEETNNVADEVIDTEMEDQEGTETNGDTDDDEEEDETTQAEDTVTSDDEEDEGETATGADTDDENTTEEDTVIPAE